MIKIKCGLDLFISGVFEQCIEVVCLVCSVVLIGFDYYGMKLIMVVQVGDWVKLGQVLFIDKKNFFVSYIVFGVGVVSVIYCGEKCVL